MDIEYIKNNFYFEILSSKHDLTDFKCASDDLNYFIKNDALRQQEMNLNITQLAICDGEIIGFVSILTDTLKIKSLEDKSLKEEMKDELNVVGEDNTLPAIKIGLLLKHMQWRSISMLKRIISLIVKATKN